MSEEHKNSYWDCCLQREDFYEIACQQFGWAERENSKYGDDTYRNAFKDYYFDMFLEHPDHPNWEIRVGMLGNDFTFAKITYSEGVEGVYDFYSSDYPSIEEKRQALYDFLESHAAGNFDFMDKPVNW